MRLLADKMMGFGGNINTVDHTGLLIVLPRKPLASLIGWFIGLSNWKTNQ